jgi:hypothetical protein
MKKLNFLFLIAVLCSCSKETVEPETQPKYEVTSTIASKSNKEHKIKTLQGFLTGKDCRSYRYIRQFNNGIDVTNFVAPCDFDNILTVCADGSYSEDEGPSKCIPDEPQLENLGTYSFTSDSTISLQSRNLNTIFKIIELKPSILKLSFPVEGLGTIEFWFEPLKK